MTKAFDVIEHAGNGQVDGVTMDLASFSTVLQAIFAEGADYTKKSVEIRLTLVEKLLGAKSLETVIQIQSDYAKTAYAAFIAQATKMGELHSTLAKAAFKPAEQAIAAMQGMQGTKQ
ncbi:MAG: phasin family protein [Methylocella sp.]|nr:MAG: Phasin [Hyphomicrobiales bacterium]